MSFFNKILYFIDACYLNSAKQFSVFQFNLLLGGTVGHMAYAYGVRSEEVVTIKSKYQIFNTTHTDFAVNTIDNKQLMIPSSLWYWQFNVTEKWNSLEEGKTYNVSTYGIRVPALGMFPNIVSISDYKQ